MNFFPCYRGTGGRVEHISPDWREWRIRIPLNWRTRNYVNTTFGGSMYGAIDPIYMLAFMHLLGPDYVVWDKGATVRFKRPGRTTLRATLRVTPEHVDEVAQACAGGEKYERTFPVQLVDEGGQVCCEVDKLLYFRKRKAGEGAQARRF
jgi:acyl-coenzyme A thioesterase PaaI-like protein